MGNTLLINIFAWSILGGLLHVCQIVIHFDVLLFYGIVISKQGMTSCQGSRVQQVCKRKETM